MVSISISSVLGDQGIREKIIQQCKYDLSGENTSHLLDVILEAIPKIERFSQDKYLDKWALEITQAEDEGIEFLIIHDELDLLAFILDDGDKYEIDDVIETTSIDSFVTHSYQELLRNKELTTMLIEELEMWEMDSEYHPYAIAHLKFIIEKGFELPVFGGDQKLSVELNWDNEELFVGGTDEEAMSSNPDYNLLHEHFKIDKPEEALEMGIQAWTEFAEEDDDWEGELDDDDELEEEFDDDWDAEAEDWDPGFDEDEAE